MNSCDGSQKKLYSLLVLLPSLALAIGLSSCYTQFGSNKGDYWNYTGKPQRDEAQARPVDTVRPPEPLPPPAVVSSDTFQSAPTTVINNYYYNDGWDGSWWDRYGWDHYYRHHHPGFSLTVVIGDPYWVDPWHPAYYYSHRYCENWYWCDDYWYHPTYRGPGWVTWEPYYPYPPYPFYGCSAPSYYYDPYWWPHYPYWYGDRFYGGHYGHGTTEGRTNVRSGRITGGERRVTEQGTGGAPRIDRAPAVDTRNAPVHVEAPSEVSTPPTRAGAPSDQPGDVDRSRTPDTRVPTKQPARPAEGQGVDRTPNTPAAPPQQPSGRQPGQVAPRNEPQPGVDRTPERPRAEPKPDDGQRAPERPAEPQQQPRQEPERPSQAPRQSESRPERQNRESEHTYREPSRDAVRDENRSSESSPSRSNSESNSSSSSERHEETHSSGRAR